MSSTIVWSYRIISIAQALFGGVTHRYSSSTLLTNGTQSSVSKCQETRYFGLLVARKLHFKHVFLSSIYNLHGRTFIPTDVRQTLTLSSDSTGICESRMKDHPSASLQNQESKKCGLPRVLGDYSYATSLRRDKYSQLLHNTFPLRIVLKICVARDYGESMREEN